MCSKGGDYATTASRPTTGNPPWMADQEGVSRSGSSLALWIVLMCTAWFRPRRSINHIRQWLGHNIRRSTHYIYCCVCPACFVLECSPNYGRSSPPFIHISTYAHSLLSSAHICLHISLICAKTHSRWCASSLLRGRLSSPAKPT